MGIFSRFEDKMDDAVEGAGARMSKAPISPVQIAKKAEKQMRRETMVGAGKQFAPTLYTVLVNRDDDDRLFGYYPTLAGETETYLSAKATQEGLVMDGNPLVRFIVDDGLRHGKFDVIAEVVAAPIVAELRAEEMERYGIAPQPARPQGRGQAREAYDARAPREEAPAEAQQEQQAHKKPPLPYVPEDEIDRSIDYGEYTFNSEDFEDYRANDPEAEAAVAYNETIMADDAAQAGAAVGGASAAAAAGVGSAAARVNAHTAGPGTQRPDRGQLQPDNTVALAEGAEPAPAAGDSAPARRTVRARLIELDCNRKYDLAGTRITIGRETDNNIKVSDINASRHHAELMLNQQGLWVITDLGSTNGTLVNDISVASQPLYPGDVVTIGKTEYEFALV